MRTVLLTLLLTGCASLPDTPLGNYPVGPVHRQQHQGTSYSCWNGGTEIIVRGAANPDPQACKPIERI